MDDKKLIVSNSPAELLRIAIESKCDIQQLEKLMDLQERWNKQQAQKKYFLAKSKFQSICPDLKKTKKVSYPLKDGGGSVNYNYTPLGDISKQIKKPLGECELSYRWELEERDNKIICTCIIAHSDGYFEKTTMSAHADTSGRKNEIQQKGSTITYLQRYTLTSVLGISTADEDNDGISSCEKKQPEIKEFEIPEDVKRDLHLMTTTQELDKYLQEYCGSLLKISAFRKYAGTLRKKLEIKSNPSKIQMP